MDDKVGRCSFSTDELSLLSKEELLLRCQTQADTIQALEKKIIGESKPVEELKLKLSAKEQEVREYVTQIAEIKQSMNSSAVRSALLDPAVNIIFQRMKKELKQKNEALVQMQNEMSAWKFTSESTVGKKLMARCRQLANENLELGKHLSEGRLSQIEAEASLQKKYKEEILQDLQEYAELSNDLDSEMTTIQGILMNINSNLSSTNFAKSSPRKTSNKPQSSVRSQPKPPVPNNSSRVSVTSNSKRSNSHKEKTLITAESAQTPNVEENSNSVTINHNSIETETVEEHNNSVQTNQSPVNRKTSVSSDTFSDFEASTIYNSDILNGPTASKQRRINSSPVTIPNGL